MVARPLARWCKWCMKITSKWMLKKEGVYHYILLLNNVFFSVPVSADQLRHLKSSEVESVVGKNSQILTTNEEYALLQCDSLRKK